MHVILSIIEDYCCVKLKKVTLLNLDFEKSIFMWGMIGMGEGSRSLFKWSEMRGVEDLDQDEGNREEGRSKMYFRQLIYRMYWKLKCKHWQNE